LKVVVVEVSEEVAVVLVEVSEVEVGTVEVLEEDLGVVEALEEEAVASEEEGDTDYASHFCSCGYKALLACLFSFLGAVSCKAPRSPPKVTLPDFNTRRSTP
jgi:hypothetical protein